MRRVGAKGEGKFEVISWQTAIDEISCRLRKIIDEYSGQSILPYCYAGTMGVIQGDTPKAFFRAIGSLELDQTICATTGGAAWEANYGPNKISTDTLTDTITMASACLRDHALRQARFSHIMRGSSKAWRTYGRSAGPNARYG
jgi:anaerobic selenocysteine-containing dehydrogenase